MKLHFRNIKEDDLEMILAWRTNPEVTRYMFTDPDLSLEKQRRWFERIAADTTRLEMRNRCQHTCPANLHINI